METVNGLRKRVKRIETLFLVYTLLGIVTVLFLFSSMSVSKATAVLSENPENHVQWINKTVYVNVPNPTMEELEAVIVLGNAADKLVFKTEP